MASKVKNADQIYFTKDHQMVRKAVAEFIKKEINPNVDQWEEEKIAPLKDIFKKMVTTTLLTDRRCISPNKSQWENSGPARS